MITVLSPSLSWSRSFLMITVLSRSRPRSSWPDPTVTPTGPTPTPTSSAPAGIALQIAATAAITTARRVIIMCSYHYETLRGQPREVANCSDGVRDFANQHGRVEQVAGC